VNQPRPGLLTGPLLLLELLLLLPPEEEVVVPELLDEGV